MKWIVSLGMSLVVVLIAYAMLDAQGWRASEAARMGASASTVTMTGVPAAR